MRSLRIATTIAGLLVTLGIGSASSFAKGELDCRLLEVRASNEEGGLDDKLKGLASKLKKPPFSSWKTFKLLKEHNGSIQLKKTLKVTLVTEGVFSLLHRGVATAADRATRLRLSFTLDDGTGERKLDGTINVDSGDYYLIGGDRLKDGGTYVLAVSCSHSS